MGEAAEEEEKETEKVKKEGEDHSNRRVGDPVEHRRLKRASGFGTLENAEPFRFASVNDIFVSLCQQTALPHSDPQVWNNFLKIVGLC